jgi:hypothetical protein
MSFAEIEEVTWLETEVIDNDFPFPSNTSSSSAVHTPDWFPWSDRNEWHVVYVKNMDVYIAARDSSGWGMPHRLTTSGHAKDPKLACSTAQLHVVWEDDRTGHPEIWERRWDGMFWTPDSCLTEDDVDSRAPAIAKVGGEVYLVWEEGPDLARQVYGRSWDGAGWGVAEQISMSPGEAREPSVTYDAADQIHVAWSDLRHGPAEIYLRTRDLFGSWEAETRMTDLPGICAKPCIHAEFCCGDIVGSELMLAFENNQTGATEIYGLCYQPPGPVPEPMLISPDDGHSSTRPNVHGFTYVFLTDFFESTYGRYLVSFTDRTAPGAEVLTVTFFPACGAQDGSEILSTTGRAWILVSAIEGSPDAEILALWTENQGPDGVLVARRGLTPGCFYPQFFTNGTILLAPEGVPENVIRGHDGCQGGGPLEGYTVEMGFTLDLDEQLTWDPEQEHPWLPPVETDENGEAIFPIRGGGCSEEGIVIVRVNGVEIFNLFGAKSPDVDGDCMVRIDDLLYVTSMLGTDDFCADLDGDREVTEEDVAIVEATLGHLCSHLIGVEDDLPSLPGAGPRLAITPNPCAGRAAIRLGGLSSQEVFVRVYDAGGRLVSDLGRRPVQTGSAAFVWESRDQMGRRLGSGIYYVVIRDGSLEMRRPLVLIR